MQIDLERIRQQWSDDPNVHSIWVEQSSANQEVRLCFGVHQKCRGREEIFALGSRPIPSEIAGLRTEVYVSDARKRTDNHD